MAAVPAGMAVPVPGMAAVASATSGGRPLSQALTAMAHSLPTVIVISLALRVVFLLGVSWLADYDANATLILIITVLVLNSHLRRGGLCLRCATNVPLDPQREVTRNKWFLYQTHWSRRKFLLIFGACCALMWVGNFINGDHTSLLNRLLHLPLDFMFYTIIWAAWIHHRLEPWCPYCRRWDEGGDPEFVPDPDPAEKATR